MKTYKKYLREAKVSGDAFGKGETGETIMTQLVEPAMKMGWAHKYDSRDDRLTLYWESKTVNVTVEIQYVKDIVEKSRVMASISWYDKKPAPGKERFWHGDDEGALNLEFHENQVFNSIPQLLKFLKLQTKVAKRMK